MTPKAIREMMIESGDDWLNDFPDDLRPDAIEIKNGIMQTFFRINDKINAAYYKIAHLETRKEYARAVLTDYKQLAPWLFKLRDGRFDENELLRKMDLGD